LSITARQKLVPFPVADCGATEAVPFPVADYGATEAVPFPAVDETGRAPASRRQQNRRAADRLVDLSSGAR